MTPPESRALKGLVRRWRTAARSAPPAVALAYADAAAGLEGVLGMVEAMAAPKRKTAAKKPARKT